MPPRRTHRRKHLDDSDLHVPIDGERVRELLREVGLSAAELARRVGTSPQNIAHMMKVGASRRCRAGLRRQVANALGVPEELLAGEPVAWPGGPLAPEGYEYRYSIRTELAASRLLTKAAAAFTRDLRQLGTEEQIRLLWPPYQLLGETVLGHIAELIRVKDWRQKLVSWHPGIEQARGYTEPATDDAWAISNVRFVKPKRRKGVRWPRNARVAQWESNARRREDPQHEEGVLALIRGVEYLLQPWFDGEAALNYRGLRDFTRLTVPPQPPVEERWPPTSPFAAFLPAVEITLPHGMREVPPIPTTSSGGPDEGQNA
jgi:transcriptional regulator with XRE-family HTH domain